MSNEEKNNTDINYRFEKNLRNTALVHDWRLSEQFT